MSLNIKNFVTELIVSLKYTKNQAEAQKEERGRKKGKKTYIFLKLGIEHIQKKIYHLYNI